MADFLPELLKQLEEYEEPLIGDKGYKVVRTVTLTHPSPEGFAPLPVLEAEDYPFEERALNKIQLILVEGSRCKTEPLSPKFILNGFDLNVCQVAFELPVRPTEALVRLADYQFTLGDTVTPQALRSAPLLTRAAFGVVCGQLHDGTRVPDRTAVRESLAIQLPRYAKYYERYVDGRRDRGANTA